MDDRHKGLGLIIDLYVQKSVKLFEKCTYNFCDLYVIFARIIIGTFHQTKDILLTYTSLFVVQKYDFHYNEVSMNVLFNMKK